MIRNEQKAWRKVEQRREAYVEFLQELVRASAGGEEATSRARRANDTPKGSLLSWSAAMWPMQQSISIRLSQEWV